MTSQICLTSDNLLPSTEGIFGNTSIDQGCGYHPSIDFRYEAPFSYDFGNRG